MSLIRLLDRLEIRDTGFITAPFIRNLGGNGETIDLTSFVGPGGSTYLTLNQGFGAAHDAFTISFWLYHENDADTSGHFYNNGQADEIRAVWSQTNENLSTRFVNNAGSTQAQFSASTLQVNAGDIKHYMISGSIASGRVSIWVNGVEDAFDATVTGAGWDSNGTNYLFSQNGSINTLVWDETGVTGIWISDEYVSTPVGTFIEAATSIGPGAAAPTPRAGGANGSGFTGTEPATYFPSTADIKAGTNRGSAGDWTVNGSTWNDLSA